MKIPIIILMLFILGALLIISNNNLALSQEENLNAFFDLYGEWMNQLYSNFYILTGDVIRLDWLPE